MTLNADSVEVYAEELLLLSFPLLWIHLVCSVGPQVWQMGRGFWVSCTWNLGCQITTEFAVIAGLLNWQILPLNLGFAYFSIIMIYCSLFQTHETSTLRLFQKANCSVLLIVQETFNSIQNSSHSPQRSQHAPVFLGKVSFPESSPSHCSRLLLQKFMSVNNFFLLSLTLFSACIPDIFYDPPETANSNICNCHFPLSGSQRPWEPLSKERFVKLSS